VSVPSVSGEWKKLRAALTFLTRLSVSPQRVVTSEELAGSVAYYPLVGAVVGLVGASAFMVARVGLSAVVAALAAVIATMVMTGALHEDGLADAADGFGGGSRRDRVLEIMRDSRIGAYGAVVLIVATLLRVEAIAALATGGISSVARAMVAAHTIARWSSVFLLRWLPLARADDSRAGAFAKPGLSSLAIASACTGAIATLAVGITVVPMLLVSIMMMCVAARYFMQRIGGITGDCLGLVCVLTEVACYLVLAWSPRA
jgi:adenosylcobinamide-GDP ribazoletransferase